LSRSNTNIMLGVQFISQNLVDSDLGIWEMGKLGDGEN